MPFAGSVTPNGSAKEEEGSTSRDKARTFTQVMPLFSPTKRDGGMTVTQPAGVGEKG